MSSIKLSQKHGVNPTIPVCFFCGEQKNEIALLGKLKGDVEAPKNCVLDYEPCDKCKEHMNMGVTLIEVSDVQPMDKRPPLTARGNQQVYPLGGWCVIKPEATKRIFNQDFTEGQKVFVDSEVFKMIMGGSNK